MTFEVRVTDDFMIDGLAIYIADKQGSGRRLLRIGAPGAIGWEDVDPVTVEAKLAGATGEISEATNASATPTKPDKGGQL